MSKKHHIKPGGSIAECHVGPLGHAAPMQYSTETFTSCPYCYAERLTSAHELFGFAGILTDEGLRSFIGNRLNHLMK